MPNTLAHLGAQALATRAIIRRADLKWVFAGAVVPDVPWIVGRITRTLLPALHGHELWAYLIAQSSLAVSLLLCAALAALAISPRRAFAILATNAFLHLLLDGLQDKWGTRVHLVAPISWRGWSAGWFGVESWPAYLLTAAGAAVAVWALRRPQPGDRPIACTVERLPVVGVLLIAYVVVPALLRHGPIEADANSVGTLGDRGRRTGRSVTFDRVRYRLRGDRQVVRTAAGEELLLTTRPLQHPATISARATFVDDSTLSIQQFHEHRGWPRDLMNYIGLSVVAITWLVGLAREQAPSLAAGATARSVPRQVGSSGAGPR